MKIAVLGAGAMGSLYGMYLAKKNEVVMIDVYKPQVEAINELGLTMLEDGVESTSNVQGVMPVCIRIVFIRDPQRLIKLMEQ